MQMQIRQAWIPGGLSGTRITLKLMRRYVDAAQSNPTVYQLARSIVSRAPGKDHAAEAAALYHWTRRHIAYRWDPAHHEAIQTAENTIRMRTGDCDDMAILIAALAESLGLKSRFMVGGYKQGQYEHVWPEVFAGGRWVALDATEGHGAGWRPPLPAQMSAIKAREDKPMHGLRGWGHFVHAVEHHFSPPAIVHQAVAAIQHPQAAVSQSVQVVRHPYQYVPRPEDVIHKVNAIVTKSITKSPLFHTLSKKDQILITETPIIPANMHELEDRFRADRRDFESKMAHVDPAMKEWYAHEQRQDQIALLIKTLKIAMEAYKLNPSASAWAYIQTLEGKIASLAAKEKKYMKNGEIVMAVVSVVVSVFTLGAGGVVLFAAWGAFEAAVGTGVAIAISTAASAVVGAMKGIAKADTAGAAALESAMEAMAAYPPPGLKKGSAVVHAKTPQDVINEANYSMLLKTAHENGDIGYKGQAGPLLLGGVIAAKVLGTAALL